MHARNLHITTLLQGLDFTLFYFKDVLNDVFLLVKIVILRWKLFVSNALFIKLKTEFMSGMLADS